MEDKIIVCKDCGKEFTFTVGEQEFYAQKGFVDPVRCKECKAINKARRAEAANINAAPAVNADATPATSDVNE